MKKQVGFTLIELIIVIVILGILAAYAVPKYMTVDKEARISVVKGLRGTLLAGADLVSAVAAAKGTSGTYPAKTVDTGRATISLGASNYPLPSDVGIGAAIADTSGFTCTAAGDVYTCNKDGSPTPANCSVVYTYNSPGSAGSYPTVSPVDISGC